MKVIKYPTKDQWTELLKRPALNTESLFDTVRSIIDKVRAEGDKAVLEYEATFDKVTLSSLVVTPEEIRVAETLVSDKLKAAISLAKQNIETFHSAQRFVGKKVETMNGVTCWQKAVGIEKVGLYIPGGTAPLFSTVLMLAVRRIRPELPEPGKNGMAKHSPSKAATGRHNSAAQTSRSPISIPMPAEIRRSCGTTT